MAFDLSSLAFSTAADTKDSQVTVKLGDTVLGTFPVDNTIGTDIYDEYGKATVSFTLPAGLPAGDQTLTVTGAQTGTIVLVPITLKEAAPTGPVDLTFLNINDFHGRIEGSKVDGLGGTSATDNTLLFAGTVEQQRAEAGEENTALLSAGDNIGASLFASAVADDQPTIDVLDALDLRASAVGNHEFDKGFADLTDRVIADGNNAQVEVPGRQRVRQGHHDAGAARVPDPHPERGEGRHHRRGHRGDPVAGLARRHRRSRLR